MKLFFRALLLAILGASAFGGAVLWAISGIGSTTTDPGFVATQTVLILAALVFGAYALLQARDDYAAYRKANKKPNHALNAALVLIAVLVLAFAGYKAWQGTQPIDVTLTYLNGTTNQPIVGATLYAQDSNWGNSQQPEIKMLTTDAEGKARLSVKRGTYYSISEKPAKNGIGSPSIGQIETYGVEGTSHEILLYAGETWFGNNGHSDVYTVKVVDPQGTPIASAGVTFHTSSDTQTTMQTDAKGEATLNDNSYNSLPVQVIKEGYGSQTTYAQNGELTLVMLTPLDAPALANQSD